MREDGGLEAEMRLDSGRGFAGRASAPSRVELARSTAAAPSVVPLTIAAYSSSASSQRELDELDVLVRHGSTRLSLRRRDVRVVLGEDL